ncbi:DUF5652 family protein [Leifsonia xyli]|uniref:DUF5652 family protein n=1 Tax=Leifsonia xyli TaxID=1575 RepID=UPI003D674FF6
MKNSATHFRMADIPPSRRAMFVGVIAWSLAWKGASLWRAARNGSAPWFVVLLLSNTMGALDAVYLFAVDRRRPSLRRDEEAILAATGEPEQGGHGDEPRGPLGP